MFDLEKLSFVGHRLSRPECALAHSSGMIFAPDWTGDGGVSVVFPNGTTKRHLAKNWADMGFDEPLRPNGICLLKGGNFLLTHLGAERGGIFHLATDGMVSPYLLEVDDEVLPPTNFVTVDGSGRTWITVSTRQTPRAKAYRSDIADGFIVMIKDGTVRLVADGLGYTNECLVHPDGKRLFVNETFSRRLTSFDIQTDGALTNQTTIAQLEAGTYPDGLAFDDEGAAWLTSIISNRVLKVDGHGTVSTFLQDADEHHVAWVEEAYMSHAIGRPHLDTATGDVLCNISNLAFYGPSLDRAVLGCLLGQELATCEMPVRGHQPVHWTFDITSLLKRMEKQPAI